MVKKAPKKECRISWVRVFFCLIFIPGSLLFPQFGFTYQTPNNGSTWTMQDLVERSHGAVRHFNEYYIISDNIIIADRDTLDIGPTDILVFDCSKKVVRLTIAGNLISATGCSSIIADKPICTIMDLDGYQRYPGIIYDDLGIRRRATPEIKSTATSWSTFSIKSFTSDTEATIHGTITDASTGKLIPARISIRKSDGQYVCDTDSAGNYVNYYLFPGFWTSDGTFQCTVPSRTTDITISQGYEYVPYHATLDISSGEIRTLAISLTPIVSMNSIGWYAGDAHNHISHGEKTFQTDIPFASRIARGQGCDWFYAGYVWGTYTTYYSLSTLTELTLQANTTNFLCLWNKEYPKDFMGHMVCPGIVDYRFLHENSPTNIFVNYPHFELTKEIEAQGGLSIYTHPLREYNWVSDSTYYPGEQFPQNVAREFPFDILAIPELNPIIDFMTDFPDETDNPQFWYYLLNRGYRIGCAAFTDAAFDRIDCSIGHDMTYVYIPDTSKNPDGSLNASSIINACKQSKTIGTSGPLVLFNIGNHIPGETITISTTNTFQATIQVYCVNRLGYYLKTIALLRNGEVEDYFDIHDMHLQSFSTTINFSESTQAWYLVRVTGTDQRKYLSQIAYTSPIYFALGSSYQSPQPVYAHVTGNVYDLGIPDPINAQIEIFNFGEVIQSFTAVNGAFDITIPATSRIRVSYGQCTITKSIFLDYKPLYDKIVRCRATDLSNPGFYDDLTALLGTVKLDFQIPIELGGFEKNVFVVVIDGARYTETFGNNSVNIDHGIIPHIWNDLRPLGSINTSFYNLGTTVTNPGHANIATGTWQDIPNDGSQRPYQPTFFEYYRKQENIDSTLTWMIAGKYKLNVISYSTTAGYGAAYGAMVYAPLGYMPDDTTWTGIQNIMDTYHPKLVFINLASVDAGGHSGVWSNYTSAITNADRIVFELWSKITTDSFYRDQTDLIVINDHGRHDDAHGGFQSHGDDCDGCRHIMFLGLGPDFKPNYIDSMTRSQIDICPTIGWFLGYHPTQAIGIPMGEMLTYIPVELIDFDSIIN